MFLRDAIKPMRVRAQLRRQISKNNTKQFLSPNFCPGMVALIESSISEARNRKIQSLWFLEFCNYIHPCPLIPKRTIGFVLQLTQFPYDYSHCLSFPTFRQRLAACFDSCHWHLTYSPLTLLRTGIIVVLSVWFSVSEILLCGGALSALSSWLFSIPLPKSPALSTSPWGEDTLVVCRAWWKLRRLPGTSKHKSFSGHMCWGNI